MTVRTTATRTMSVRALATGVALAAGMTAGTAAVANESRGSVNLAYVEWSSEIASTNVVRAVLEQQGFDVEMSSLSAAAMWQAIATGDADAMVAAWLPTTHANYLDRLGDRMVDLGVNLDGTQLGLVVPDYVEATSIEELADQADVFDGRIVGIDPGAGIMSTTETVMETYGLDDLNLVSGSGATMTAALGSAIDNQEPIVVTGWTPHWMFARWDLRYLDDPENVYGGAEQIHTFVREGFEEEMPVAACILDNFEWGPEQMGEVMLLNQEEGADPYEDAQQWVENNPEMVDEWTQGCDQHQS